MIRANEPRAPALHATNRDDTASTSTTINSTKAVATKPYRPHSFHSLAICIPRPKNTYSREKLSSINLLVLANLINNDLRNANFIGVETRMGACPTTRAGTTQFAHVVRTGFVLSAESCQSRMSFDDAEKELPQALLKW